MSRVIFLVRRYGLDALIAIAAIRGVLDVALRNDAVEEPRTTHWIVVPAIALVVLPLLGRRRFPFAARRRFGSSPRPSRSSTDG